MGHQINIRNRDSYPMFMPSPITEYHSKVRVNGVSVDQLDIDGWYHRLKDKGLTFIVDNPEILENGKRPMNGIFSPWYGSDTTQDAPIYSCDCHEMTGGNNLGRICPKCHTVVRTIEADLRRVLFADIAPYHILTFHGYNALAKILKKKVLDKIITTTRSISKSGKVKEDALPTIMDIYEDYDELYYPITKLDKKYAFMSKIPIYSARLRPLLTTGNTTLTLLDVNQFYLSIVQSSLIVRSGSIIPDFSREIEVQKTLNQIQQDFNNVCNEVLKQCNTKYGVFRHTLASGRVDKSSRLVITLGQDLKPSEIDVPYQTMMVQYEAEIADYIVRKENIPLSKAISMVIENSQIATPYFVNIINSILREGHGIWTLINRNPTITKSGILYARIRQIHEDCTDMTAHLPQDILALMNADFDWISQTNLVPSYRNVGCGTN